MVADLTDLPSPHSWQMEKDLVDDLSIALQTQFNSTNHIRHIIKEEHSTLTNLIQIVSNIELDLAGQFDLIIDLMRDSSYISRICLQGNTFGNHLINESLTAVESIC